MSGGSLDYGYFKINMIIEHIEEAIKESGSYGTTYSKEMADAIFNAIWELKKASIYAKRLEWLFSGDDSEADYFRRIQEDIKDELSRFESYKKELLASSNFIIK